MQSKNLSTAIDLLPCFVQVLKLLSKVKIIKKIDKKFINDIDNQLTNIVMKLAEDESLNTISIQQNNIHKIGIELLEILISNSFSKINNLLSEYTLKLKISHTIDENNKPIDYYQTIVIPLNQLNEKYVKYKNTSSIKYKWTRQCYIFSKKYVIPFSKTIQSTSVLYNIYSKKVTKNQVINISNGVKFYELNQVLVETSIHYGFITAHSKHWNIAKEDYIFQESLIGKKNIIQNIIAASIFFVISYIFLNPIFFPTEEHKLEKLEKELIVKKEQMKKIEQKKNNLKIKLKEKEELDERRIFLHATPVSKKEKPTNLNQSVKNKTTLELNNSININNLPLSKENKPNVEKHIKIDDSKPLISINADIYDSPIIRTIENISNEKLLEHNKILLEENGISHISPNKYEKNKNSFLHIMSKKELISTKSINLFLNSNVIKEIRKRKLPLYYIWRKINGEKLQCIGLVFKKTENTEKIKKILKRESKERIFIPSNLNITTFSAEEITL